MTDYRDEFQRLLEKTFIPAVGNNRAETEKELNRFLNKVFLNIPEKLFRYRQCDEKGYSFDSLKHGTISLCNASCFSDKYDSRVYVDREKVLNDLIEGYKNAISDLLLKEIQKKNPMLKTEYAAEICYYKECGLSDEEIIDKIINEQYTDYIQKVGTDMKNREFRFRKSNTSAKIGCFTESVQSKFMWDHYAGGYTGFALEYNLKEFLYKCQPSSDVFPCVFPVIYTDLLPDVTMDEGNAYMREESLKQNWMNSWAALYHSIPLNALHLFKPYLYKDKAEYAHEREWRIICYDFTNKDDYSLIPDLNCLKAIYYGPDISSENREILHNIAQQRGIAEYDVTFDLDSRAYGLKVQKNK